MKTNKITITENESKICKIDGVKFKSSREMLAHVKKKYKLSFEDYIINCYYDGTQPTCLKTGNQISFKPNKLGPWFSNYAKNCSPRKSHTKESKLKIKIGCEKRSMEMYNVKNPFQSENVKEKIRETNLKKYGVENPMQHEKFKRFEPRSIESIEKGKKTNIKKYGMVTFSSTKAGKIKIKNSLFKHNYKCWKSYVTKLSNVNVDIMTPEKEFSVSGNKFRCKLDGKEWESPDIVPYCPKCAEEHKDCRSNFEREFVTFLDEIGINYKKNKKFERKYELDVFLEKKNIGIELNGLFWHSELNGKGKSYHNNKLKFFNDRKIRVVQIIEDEWNFKRDTVKQKIKSILKVGSTETKKIHARKCRIEKISNRISSKFIDSNHIQGNVSATHCYGAFYDNDLVAVMTFSNMRKALGSSPKKDTYELIRFCVVTDKIITGIFGKMMSRFIGEVGPTKIVSYADRRFTDSNENIYVKNGFELLHISDPGYWYIKGHVRLHRYGFQKNKLIKQGFDPSLSEWQIMKNRKYNRIWDCGQFRFEKTISI
jgi:G:T-mismatch repair DNA endonuclease (very short patch repair protein)